MLIFKLGTYNRSFTPLKTSKTTKQIELIRKKEFTAVAFDLEHKTIIEHVTALNVDPGNKMHPSKKLR